MTVGPKALSWHLSPLRAREPSWDSFLQPVLFWEPDWDSFVVLMVISELDWDSYVLPVVISELDSNWDLFGLLVYRQIVSQRPTDPYVHGVSEFLFSVTSRDLEVEVFPS
jgi:hypothetical protein